LIVFLLNFLQVRLWLTPIPVNALLSLAEARSKAVDDFQVEYLQELLTRNCGRIKQTAQAADISTRQLHKLIEKIQP